MFREEFKKLYVKQFGLILAVILIIGEIIFVNILYPKRSFANDFTEGQFYEYMESFSGALTPEKEQAILAEQERIVDARNIENEIENKLRQGGYQSEDEFLDEYERIQLVTKCKDAFDIIFKQYSYALEKPQKRYLTVGDYSGLGVDCPDVLLLALVIYLTSVLFLSEESSNVITFIRISENGKQKTLWGKFVSLLVLIVSAQLFRTVFELLTLISRGNLQELAYPVQTIEFFQNCPYDISILQAFFAISALRFLGYLFISSLVILLSVTIRKALFTVFIPSAVCLLQQFAFDPATPAYYIPTGFLRAVGYFRGDVLSKSDSGESVKLFAEIPLSHLLPLVIITAVFVLVSLVVAYRYYVGNSGKFVLKLASVVAAFVICALSSGCARKQSDNVIYNYRDGLFFAQNDEYYFVESGGKLSAFSKDNGRELDVLRDAFILNDWQKTFVLYGDNLYHSKYFTRDDIYKFSLDTFSNEIAVPAVKSTQGFLGVTIKKKMPIAFITDGIFTDGKNFYWIGSNRVYCEENGNIVKLFDEKISGFNLSFDGQNIYYINGLLQLKRYNLESREESRLPGEFVQAIYYDGTRLLYSDRKGIFSLDTSDLSVEKISDITTNRISSDGKEIIYKNGDQLYLLGFDDPIYTAEKESDLVNFAVISDNGKYAIQNGVGVSKVLEFPDFVS